MLLQVNAFRGRCPWLSVQRSGWMPTLTDI